MATITNLIIVLILFVLQESSDKQYLSQIDVSSKPTNTIVKDSAQARAFEIITKKCNICHVNRNRRRIFTKENMNEWSNDVYKQVFIKRRMPKGKKIKLTSEEYQDLLTWISSTKK